MNNIINCFKMNKKVVLIVYQKSFLDFLNLMPITPGRCFPDPDFFLLTDRNISSHNIPTNSITRQFRKFNKLIKLNNSPTFSIFHIDLKYFKECITCHTQQIITSTVHQGP